MERLGDEENGSREREISKGDREGDMEEIERGGWESRVIRIPHAFQMSFCIP